MQSDRETYLGHIADLSNDAYHDAAGYSKSMLDAAAGKSMRHFWAKYIDPNRVRETTDAMDLGQAIHTAILEPDYVTTRIAQEPKVDRRTKIGKETAAAFELENAGKLIIAHDAYQAVLDIRDACFRHPVAGGLLTRGRAEQSYFAVDPETGETMKCRADYIHNDGSMIIDVKSAVDASPAGFGRAAANFRYDVQSAWYPDVVTLVTGTRPANFVWIAFEKDPPYAIGVYFATPEQVTQARTRARADFKRILAAVARDYWPDYGTEAIQELQLPAWVNR